MAHTFNLPDIGSGLQEAEIVAWHVGVGDTVTADQVLCEVETEKSVVEIPSPFGGVVLELAGPAGTSVKVGEMLIVIGEAGEDLGGAAAEPVGVAAAVAETPPAVSGAPEPLPEPAPGVLAPVVSARVQAMPLVRRLARQHGVDLAAVTGTGVGGRITRKDVEAAAASAGPVAAVGPATAAAVPEGRVDERLQLSKLRRTIAAHMTGQWQNVPHITAHVEAEATRFLEVRRTLSEAIGKTVPVDALLVAIVVPALKRYPRINATIDGGEIVLHHYCDVGVAVGSEDGLLVPIVRNADRISIGDLVDVVTDLTTRAKDRKLTPEEMGDQTFTVSNLGSLRGWHATQVIPAGTTGIVSFGRAMDRPVVRDGALASGPVMAVSGTFDHRAVDGLDTMGFLNAIVDAIEEPALLLL
jgi:pyruvate dehydrogenase E2 component (dihydrolipoamide acetyltransferase)